MPGVQIFELLPRLAKMMDHLGIIRSQTGCYDQHHDSIPATILNNALTPNRLRGRVDLLGESVNLRVGYPLIEMPIREVFPGSSLGETHQVQINPEVVVEC